MGYSLLIKGYPKNIEIRDATIMDQIMYYLINLKIFDRASFIFDPPK